MIRRQPEGGDAQRDSTLDKSVRKNNKLEGSHRLPARAVDVFPFPPPCLPCLPAFLPVSPDLFTIAGQALTRRNRTSETSRAAEIATVAWGEGSEGRKGSGGTILPLSKGHPRAV